MTGASWMSLLWFAVVLALIPLALWLLRRSGLAKAMVGTASAGPRLTGSLMLGPQQRVVTVEVGEGAERRWLVLGVTAQQITTLHTLTAPAQAQRPSASPAGRDGSRPAGSEAGAPGAAGFAQVLNRMMGRSAQNAPTLPTSQGSRTARTGRPAAPASTRPPPSAPDLSQRRQEGGSEPHVG